MKPTQLTLSYLIFIVSLTFCAQSYAQESILELEVLKEQLEKDKQALAEPIVKFQGRYIEQLEGLKKRAQAGGDLDQVLAISQEIKLIPTGGSEVPEKYDELKGLRKIYDDHVAKINEKQAVDLRKVLRDHRGKLSALQTKLTKDGKIEQAVVVKRELASVDASIASGADLSVGGVQSGVVGNSKPGKLVVFGTYSDASPATLSEKQQEGDFIRVSAAYDHWMALGADGKVSPRPGAHHHHRPDSGLRNVVEIQCGRHLQMVMKEDGSVVALGGEDQMKWVPKVEKGTVAKFSLGHSINALVLKDGTMIPFGYNFFHKQLKFERKEVMTGVADVSVGVSTYAILMKDGSALMVGNTGKDRSGRPEGLKDVVAIDAGLADGACFLTKRGKVISWRTPEPPEDLKRAVQIRVGVDTVAAQMEDGTWVLWGSNQGLAASLNAKLQELGPLKDLALGKRFFVAIK